MPQVLMVIAPRKFRDEEYAAPKEILESRGATVLTASTSVGECVGRFGLVAQAETCLLDVVPEDLDALVFVGGAGSSVFFDDPIAHELARAVHESGKIVGAICIAPSTLARAGLLKGVTATSYPDRRDDLEAHGASYSEAPVEVSGRIVTACGPDAAEAFGTALADLLGLPPRAPAA